MRVLYKLPPSLVDAAAAAIRDADEAILVEGYLDVLALHEAGVKNAVGVLGVGVTPRQLETAARFSPSRRVVLALDADDAGAVATKRLVDDVLPGLSDRAGVDAAVAPKWPGGAKDAADFVAAQRAGGSTDIAAAVAETIGAAVCWEDWEPEAT